MRLVWSLFLCSHQTRYLLVLPEMLVFSVQLLCWTAYSDIHQRQPKSRTQNVSEYKKHRLHTQHHMLISVAQLGGDNHHQQSTWSSLDVDFTLDFSSNPRALFVFLMVLSWNKANGWGESSYNKYSSISVLFFRTQVILLNSWTARLDWPELFVDELWLCLLHLCCHSLSLHFSFTSEKTLLVIAFSAVSPISLADHS